MDNCENFIFDFLTTGSSLDLSRFHLYQVKELENLRKDIHQISEHLSTHDSRISEMDSSLLGIQKKMFALEKMRAQIEDTSTTVSSHSSRIQDASAALASLARQAAAHAEGLAAAASNQDRQQAAAAAESADRARFQDRIARELDTVKADLRAYAASLGGFGASAAEHRMV